jgi:IPT/TIG domain
MWAATKEWRSPKARSSACVLAILLAAVGLQGSSSSAAPCSGFGVTDISPAVGFVTGGTAATITGCGFSGAGTLTVKFGGASPITVSPHSDDASFTVTSPAAAAPGAVTVEVRLHPAAGTDSVGTTTFTYVAKPAITKIAPGSGPEAGGTSVHVKGSALTQAGATTAVKFGATAASSVSDATSTALTAVSPAGTGTQNVTVTVTLPGGESATSNGLPFLYIPAPTVTSVSPTTGPVTGGTDVTVTGTHFQSGAHVLFGPSDGTTSLTGDSTGTPVSVLSSTSILVTAPPGIVGATNVVVLNPDGQSGALKSGSPGHYTYSGTAPSITSVSPATGSSLGGTTVTVTGAGFLAGAKVAFAATSGEQVPPPAGTSVAVSADGTQISAKTPAHAAGIVDVVVTNRGGGKATKTDAFTFSAAPAPTITALTVATGPSLGGTLLTISGTNFSAGTTVSFGGTAAASAASLNPTTITARTPAHAAGAVDVKVTLPDGQSATRPPSPSWRPLRRRSPPSLRAQGRAAPRSRSPVRASRPPPILRMRRPRQSSPSGPRLRACPARLTSPTRPAWNRSRRT